MEVNLSILQIFSNYKMFPPNLVLARAKGCDILKLKVTHGCRYIPVANRMAFVIVDTAPMFLDSKLNLMIPDCSHPPAHVENKGSGKAIPGRCTSVLKVERKTLCPCTVVFLCLFCVKDKNCPKICLDFDLIPFGHQPAVLFIKGTSSAESFSRQLLWLKVKLVGKFIKMEN